MAAPFLAAAGVVYWVFLSEFDINYYLTERPMSFWVAGILIGGLLAAMSALVIPRLVGWVYALPLHLFENVGALKALGASEERARGHRSAITVILVGWATFAVLLSTLGLALVRGLGSYLVPRFQDSLGAMLFLLGGVILLWSLVNLLATLFQAVTFALLIVRLYERVGGGQAAEAPAVSVESPVESAGSLLSRLSLSTLLGVLLIAAAVCGGIGYFLLDRVKIDHEVIAIGHRGAAGRAPENTLAAVDAAIEGGADLVEIDVQETRDGRVVVIHDSDFMKLGGVATKIWDASYEEAHAIDIGSWFGPEFGGERIATLEEVLYRCKGKARVDIELKYYGHDQRLEERVVEIVERAGMASDVVIMSLKQDGIRKIRELRPNWTLGLLLAKAAGDPTQVDADFLAVHTGLASRRFIRAAHRAGKEVYVWTVNDPIHMSMMIGRGVDGVITDDPALLNEVMERRAELSSPERLLLEVAFWMGMVPKDPRGGSRRRLRLESRN